MPRLRSRVRASFPAPVSAREAVASLLFWCRSSSGHPTPDQCGAMAEWLCSGLQSRVRRFDSGSRLQKLPRFHSRLPLKIPAGVFTQIALERQKGCNNLVAINRLQQMGCFPGVFTLRGLSAAKTNPTRIRWCERRGSNPHAAFRRAADFKSAVSTGFTTLANLANFTLSGFSNPSSRVDRSVGSVAQLSGSVSWVGRSVEWVAHQSA